MLREALTLDRLRAMKPDEAAAYFVAHGIDGLTANERAMMESWLAESAGHAAALDRANRGWDSFGDAGDDEILAAMRAHALVPATPRRLAWPRAIAVAAVVLLVVAASLLLMPGLRRPFQPRDPQSATVDYASTPTGIREVVLPDGSHMTLDASSAVRGQFTTTVRALDLVRGRAFFDVRHDNARPFSVKANGRRIVDMGTRFDASVVGGVLRVTLEQGRVSIESLKPGVATITLAPGQQFVEGAGNAKVGAAGPANWRRGLIDLEDASLADAVTEINRYSTAQIVLRDARLGAIRVSGQFRAGDAERFAQTIAELHPVRVVRQGNTIEMVPSN